jgi:hypothetical protein
MSSALKMRVHTICAVIAGLGLRAAFILKFPVAASGDSPFYMELAWNWIKKGIYGLSVDGRVIPVDMRPPGYPAFLAAIFTFAGESTRAAMWAQAAADLATCFIVALIAARVAPAACRRRVALAGLWLAALCPFTANYSAVILTETLVTFLTALAILVLLEAESGVIFDSSGTDSAATALTGRRAFMPWFLAGILAGFGTLVRAETPLLLAAATITLLAKCLHQVFVRSRTAWKSELHNFLRAVALMAMGLLLPLLPWAARNWHTLHEAQFLAPRYSLLPGESEPVGFDNWTRTWLWRFSDVYLTLWKINEETIPPSDLRAAAFDSPQERARVEALLDDYNDTLTLSPAQDAAFGAIARERTARHRLRTWVTIPLQRAFTIWFAPRVELLPYEGDLFPIRRAFTNDREDFLVTAAFTVVNIIYIALAVAGAWMARRQPGWWLLIWFIALRTAFFAAFIEAPEPRYVLECYPAVLALAAQVFCRGGGAQYAARHADSARADSASTAGAPSLSPNQHSSRN